MVAAERTGRVLREHIAVALAVGGSHESGYHVQIPLSDLISIAPEISETQIDVELQQVNP